MYDEKNVDNAMLPSSPGQKSPNRGPQADPNPGERSALDEAQGVSVDSMGILSPRGTRAGGGQEIDTGAQVGIMRNMEFSAGGRAHRLSTGTYSSARPTYDPKGGRIHVSTATGDGDSSVGPKQGTEGHSAMSPNEGNSAGPENDTSSGDVSPDRRRDKRNP